MHLTFAEAYAKVCPDGGPVVPNSREYSDIMELMRQSGHVNFQDNLVHEYVPKAPKSVQEAQPFIERQIAPGPTPNLSRRDFMSVKVNKELFLKHLKIVKSNK